jgi:hypothetical protein
MALTVKRSHRIQQEDGETLDATYYIYLVDGSDGSKINVGKRDTDTFGRSVWGECVSNERVKKALYKDGSLLVAADVEFLPPDDSGAAKVICEGALQGYEDIQRWASKFPELHGDQASSDCTIKVGTSPQ